MLGFIHRSLLVALLVVASSPALAQGADAILILDASGSMWGQVEGQTKIAAARRAVEFHPVEVEAVGSAGADRLRASLEGRLQGHRDDRPGQPLRSGAHQRRGECPRAEGQDADRGFAARGCVIAQDDRRQGHGRACLRRHRDLRRRSMRRCRGAEESRCRLRRACDRLRRRRSCRKAQLQCIARATGGVYLDARDASSLENALGRAVEATQGGRVQSEAPPRPVEDPYRGKNIRGVARLAAGLDPITDSQLGWLVHKPAGAEKGEYLTRFDGSPFAGEIAPGDYVVEVEYGLVKRLRAGEGRTRQAGHARCGARCGLRHQRRRDPGRRHKSRRRVLGGAGPRRQLARDGLPSAAALRAAGRRLYAAAEARACRPPRRASALPQAMRSTLR